MYSSTYPFLFTVGLGPLAALGCAIVVALLAQDLVVGSGLHLATVHATTNDNCLWAAVPTMVMPAQDAADAMYEGYIDDPMARDVDPPQRIDLPIGPAYQLRLSTLSDPLDVWASSLLYVLPMGEGAFVGVCTTYEARPEDDWLFIVKTVEFLTAE